MARLIFPFGFNVEDEQSAIEKGTWPWAVAEIPGLGFFPVWFVDPGACANAVTGALENSRQPCFAEPGLIVIPEVSREHMERAVAHLARTDYFHQRRPCSREDLATWTDLQQPPPLPGSAEAAGTSQSEHNRPQP